MLNGAHLIAECAPTYIRAKDGRMLAIQLDLSLIILNRPEKAVEADCDRLLP